MLDALLATVVKRTVTFNKRLEAFVRVSDPYLHGSVTQLLQIRDTNLRSHDIPKLLYCTEI